MNINNFELNEIKISNLLSLYKKYSFMKENQSRRGLNDFNLFTSLLNMTDEVRLHSRFLYTLLDVYGDHGQGSLFLDLFLRECNLSDLGINTSSCRIYKEYRYIDLYITDGIKHVIIENKIYAPDQDKQIQTYVEAIENENKDDPEIHENIIVIYLSLDRLKPSPESLGDFKCYGDKLIKNDKEYSFRSITYKNEILSWIRASRKQVGNITNLSVIIEQYEDVILKLYNKYKGKLMTLNDYINSTERNKVDILNTIRKIVVEYDALRKDIIMNKFFVKIEEIIRKEELSGWEFICENNKLQSRWEYPLRIQQSEASKVFFAFEFDKPNFIDPYYGVVKRYREKEKVIDLKYCLENDSFLSLAKNMDEFKDASNAKEWLGFKYLAKGDIFDYILEKGDENKAAEAAATELIKAFHAYKEIILTCNKILDN